MPNFFILGFRGWDFVTDLSNGVIKQSDRAVNYNTTSSWGPNLLDFSFSFFYFFYLFSPQMPSISGYIITINLECLLPRGMKFLEFKSVRMLLCWGKGILTFKK